MNNDFLKKDINGHFVGTPKNPRKSRLERAKDRKQMRVVKILLLIGLVIWLLLGTVAIASNLVEYFNTHEFRSPVTKKHTKIESPVSTKPVQKKLTLVPQAQAEETKPSIKVAGIVDRIYTLESSRGKNDGCRAKGLYNGYGYAQSTFMWKCYNTQQEVIDKVTNWVQGKLDKGFTIAELTCYYNRGIRENDCTYYQKFMSL